jgi:uncharacterized protein YwgA
MDAIISIVDAAGGELKSRIVLQKLSYFASTLGLVDTQFRPHYYGPYSEDVSIKTMTLEYLNLLKEESIRIGTQPDPWLYSMSGDVKTYRYSLTEDGKVVVAELKSRNPKELEMLGELVKIWINLKSSPAVLATAAKIDFIDRKSSHRAGKSELKTIAENLGWKLEDSQFEQALSLLDEIGELKQKIAR